jgi:allantoinase
MVSSPQLPGAQADKPDRIVRGRRVITPQGEQPAAIFIRGGVIQRIAAFDEIRPDCPIYEAGDHIVMPGLVDTHVHINEPGRAEWEGFATATRAAAAGGVTTLIEMPLNSIPATTTVAAFQKKLAAASGQLWVDTGFWGGIVPGNSGDLHALWEAGCFGFKCFLVESGVAEFDFVTEADLQEALPHLAELGAPLLVHAELPGPIELALAQRSPTSSGKRYLTWLESRPRAAENEAIALLLQLAVEYSVHIHIVHLSSAESIAQIHRAQLASVEVTVETCPHYLTFASEDIPDGATQFKCAPPIRERENREQLWQGLREGTIGMIATDHSPCPPQMKHLEKGDFLDAWGGIASVQLSLPAVWTEARQRGFNFPDLAHWLCEAPAQLAGLSAKKGSISAGCDADMVIWDADAIFRVEPERLQHRHKLTPYAGRALIGIVEATLLRGEIIYERGGFSSAPTGRVLLRGGK